jgi:tetratricopeptide (TPR) repeat protein
LVHRNISELVADGLAHHNSGRLRDAEHAYRSALEMAPGDPMLTQNLGVLAAARGDPFAAIDYFDVSIAARPRFAAAHFNRAVALQTLGRAREAIDSFSRVVALDPAHYDSHRAIGFLWLAQGERGRALDHFARTYELRRGEDRTERASRSLACTSREKLMHDAEQFRFLAERRRDGHRFAQLARAYEEVAKDFPEATTEQSDEHLAALGDDYNTAIHIRSAPELPGRAVSARTDQPSIMAHFKEREAGAVYFDELLTPEALIRLKQYLLESTIWHDFSHIGGFVASYLEDGLACPLLLQVAGEIRQMFPELLERRPLSQAWAFKGLKPTAAIEAHADDAAISINFWLTPDQANLDPGGGGLTVCRALPPPEWHMKDYDTDAAEIQSFMAKHSSDALVVPYRENRAVLFASRLFHKSDAPHFANGYESHRINVTMLFGSHES